MTRVGGSTPVIGIADFVAVSIGLAAKSPAKS